MMVKEWIDKLQKRNPSETIAMELWQTGDFEETALTMGIILTPEELIACMNYAERSHNAEIGINWDSIRCDIEAIVKDRKVVI